MPVVISDTSPLRALAVHLGHMEWLQELFPARYDCLPLSQREPR